MDSQLSYLPHFLPGPASVWLIGHSEANIVGGVSSKGDLQGGAADQDDGINGQALSRGGQKDRERGAAIFLAEILDLLVSNRYPMLQSVSREKT
jgi:hypothetical protein